MSATTTPAPHGPPRPPPDPTGGHFSHAPQLSGMWLIPACSMGTANLPRGLRSSPHLDSLDSKPSTGTEVSSGATPPNPAETDAKDSRKTSRKKTQHPAWMCMKYWFLLVGTRLQPTIPMPFPLPQLKWRRKLINRERNSALTGLSICTEGSGMWGGVSGALPKLWAAGRGLCALLLAPHKPTLEARRGMVTCGWPAVTGGRGTHLCCAPLRPKPGAGPCSPFFPLLHS